MPFPAKNRNLIDLTLNEVELPDYAWLTYAVCAVTEDSRGWCEWIIEAAFRKTGEGHPTGAGDKLLPTGDNEQICPRCRRELFRTSASIRMSPSQDQTPIHGVPGIGNEVADVEFE